MQAIDLAYISLLFLTFL